MRKEKPAGEGGHRTGTDILQQHSGKRQLIAEICRGWDVAEVIAIAAIVRRRDLARPYIDRLHAHHFAHKMTRAIARIAVQTLKTYGVADIDAIRRMTVIQHHPRSAVALLLDTVDRLGDLLDTELVSWAFGELCRGKGAHEHA